jgi:hypothetical protein
MSRVQNGKPSRRLGWAAAAFVLLAAPTAAQAQGFFFLFGNPSPYEIERRLTAAGYVLSGPLTMRGDVYLADVVVRGEGPERLVIDAQSGRILERYRVRADRWREAEAPPPSGWGDDPRQWDGPRPPAAIGPDVAPPGAFEPTKPNVLETPKAKSKAAETKPKATPKSAPVADVNNPPPAAVVPAPAVTTRAAPSSASPAAAPLSPSPAPSAAAAPPTPASSSSPPPLQAAKADAPSVAKPPSPAPAAAPAKSKAVNDIPVTPLD